jgi:hypothetical protein
MTDRCGQQSAAMKPLIASHLLPPVVGKASPQDLQKKTAARCGGLYIPAFLNVFA